jgi:hypothetical protein
MRPKKNKKGKKAITNAQASLEFTRPHHLLIGQQHRRSEATNLADGVCKICPEAIRRWSSSILGVISKHLPHIGLLR